jgi:hypothetical protein
MTSQVDEENLLESEKSFFEKKISPKPKIFVEKIFCFLKSLQESKFVFPTNLTILYPKAENAKKIKFFINFEKFGEKVGKIDFFQNSRLKFEIS